MAGKLNSKNCGFVILVIFDPLRSTELLMLDKHGDHLKSVCVKTVNVISSKVFF